MNNKQYQFKFETVNVEMVERLLKSLPDDTSSGSDNIDTKLLNVAAEDGEFVVYVNKYIKILYMYSMFENSKMVTKADMDLNLMLMKEYIYEECW